MSFVLRIAGTVVLALGYMLVLVPTLAVAGFLYGIILSIRIAAGELDL